jgi:hypothetical protein
VELAARFPESSNAMIQFFGAHAACFDQVNAHGYRLARPPIEVEELDEDGDGDGETFAAPAVGGSEAEPPELEPITGPIPEP